MKKLLTFFSILTLTSMPVSNIVGCIQQTNEEEASPEKAIAASVNNLLDKVKYDVSSKGFVFKEGDGSVKSQIEILELWLGPKNPDLGIIKDDLFWECCK